jgi:hypothetical protein
MIARLAGKAPSPQAPPGEPPTLFRFDRRPYEYKVEQIKAQLAEAKQNVDVLKVDVEVATHALQHATCEDCPQVCYIWLRVTCYAVCPSRRGGPVRWVTTAAPQTRSLRSRQWPLERI